MEEESAVKIIRTAAKTAEIIADAVLFARDIVSAPANEMTPTDLANEAMAERQREEHPVSRFSRTEEIRELGMNALLGVASGSDEPPKFIVMEYRGGKKSSPVIALVGKGLTFDSGGISIKPSEKMDQMKSDMAGGAAVIAAVRAAAELGLAGESGGTRSCRWRISPAERLTNPAISSNLSRAKRSRSLPPMPKARLILADALTYAGRYKPAAIIDLATLTGACIVALGDHVIGMMGTDDELKREIREAADLTGERVWELPLWEEYDELIKGDAADYKNSGGRAGGAITAAVFLSKFTGGYPWVHLDIAGPAWLDEGKALYPQGRLGCGGPSPGPVSPKLVSRRWRKINDRGEERRPTGMSAILEVKGLRTHFETERGIVRAVDGVDITVETGSDPWGGRGVRLREDRSGPFPPEACSVSTGTDRRGKRASGRQGAALLFPKKRCVGSGGGRSR